MKLKFALVAASAALIAGSFAAPAVAQEFPSRDITMLVGFAPGGSTDLMARILAEEMSKALGQRVSIENRAGANAVTATRAVARAAPDGYTILFNASNMASNIEGMKEPGYGWKDFAIVGGFAYSPFVMVASTASTKAKDLKEFVAFGKANPGKITYASLGSSSPPNLVAQRFNSRSGIGYREIPYKSANQITQDLLGGNVDLYFGTTTLGVSNLGQPNIAVFGISGSKRIPQLPDTPTFAEQGFEGINDVSVAGVWAPAGTPKPILDKLKKAMADAMKVPDITVQLTKAGQVLYTGTPEQFQTDIEKDGLMYRDDFKRLGVELQ
jgi:tripartite-type tricarboxylate transporter receptor subunit TctC